MKHKYPVGTWVRFYQSGKMIVGVVQYLAKKESWETDYSYSTDAGVVEESSILEARTP